MVVSDDGKSGRLRVFQLQLLRDEGDFELVSCVATNE
jgi:hypothetical protein